MLYREKAQYASNGIEVTIEIEENGIFRVFNDKETFQTGNLKEYFVENLGTSNENGAVIYKKGTHPQRVKYELAFFNDQKDPNESPAIYQAKKKSFLQVAEQFGSTKYPRFMKWLVALLIIGFFIAMFILSDFPG